MNEESARGVLNLPSQAVFGAIGPRILRICAFAVAIALAAGFVAEALLRLIGLVTNLAFFGRLSAEHASPAGHHLGWLAVLIPAVGGLVVGLLARYGSEAIRGHGIPEAMEQVLLNESRIPARVAVLKPLSAAVSIGTGGPFGAEGPIIATGGALGSLFGQIVHVTAAERKILLAAGAAAGMAATFGSPVSAVLLAIELLLFEFRARSIIPVALAAATAAGVRFALVGPAPVFAMSALFPPTGGALCFYVAVGAFMGLIAVGVTRSLYAIEDGFARLPVHWMWWPALGALVVGLIGHLSPRTLGVGYDVIDEILSGAIPSALLLSLCLLKFASWSMALGSGTSGGTLAPLFIIGGALGGVLGQIARPLLPFVDMRVAALVGMAALFAGASRATLASAVFAFETTRQPMSLLPLLAGCAASYLVSALLMKHSIMTEKIARRGVLVPTEYVADMLEQLLVRDVMTTNVVTLRAEQTVTQVRRWLDSKAPGTEHSAFPVVNDQQQLVGMATRRALLQKGLEDQKLLRDLPLGPPVAVSDQNCLRDVVDLMIAEDMGRFPVVTQNDPRKLIGIISRRDILAAYRHRRDEETPALRPRVAPKIGSRPSMNETV